MAVNMTIALCHRKTEKMPQHTEPFTAPDKRDALKHCGNAPQFQLLCWASHNVICKTCLKYEVELLVLL